MLRKNARITVYAQSGRISIKTLKRIIEQHIDAKNATFAQKALKEYIIAVNHEYQTNQVIITDFIEQINRIRA